jgi:small subunit ribosomal protein S17
VGVVTSDKMAKTRVVEIPRLVKHPRYGKYVRRKTVCYVHDEEERASRGDTVEIVESRPRSRNKRWELVRVLQQRREEDLVSLAEPGAEKETANGTANETGNETANETA